MAFKQNTKKYAKSIDKLFSLSKDVNLLKKNLIIDQAFYGDCICK